MIQDLYLEGKQFVSLREASKETGYSRDYIGQLIRADKLTARMVGRTWYVSREAINKFLEDKSQKQKYKANTEDLVSTSTVLSPEINKIESENKIGGGAEDQNVFINKAPAPIAPVYHTEIKILKKEKNTHLGKTRKPSTVSFFALAVLCLILISSLLFVFIASSDITSVSNSGSVISAAQDVLSGLTLYFRKSAPVSSPSQGVVIFPNSSNHDQEVQAVKNAFSDEVNVTLDQNGSSGVIRPVFRSGESSSGYTFVLVPLKSQK